MTGYWDSLIWADSGIYEYSTRFSIFEATCFLQERGKERVEEREIVEDFDEAISDEEEEDAIFYRVSSRCWIIILEN